MTNLTPAQETRVKLLISEGLKRFQMEIDQLKTRIGELSEENSDLKQRLRVFEEKKEGKKHRFVWSQVIA